MHGRALAILTLLFALRVLGQALVVFFSVGWLPSTEHWFSGLIRYPILLGIRHLARSGLFRQAETRLFPVPGCLQHFVRG